MIFLLKRGCVGIVESAVGGVMGVKSVSAPFLNRTGSVATVVLEPNVNPPFQNMIDALELMGKEKNPIY